MYYKELTDCETMVMKTIWDANGEISVQEIIDNVANIYGKLMKRTTASTFILRLRDKGYIEGKAEMYIIVRWLWRMSISDPEQKTICSFGTADRWRRRYPCFVRRRSCQMNSASGSKRQ